MDLKKVIRFMKMNKYEKHRSLVRNTFRFLHKKEFGAIGKKSYFLDPQFLSGTKYIYMADDVGVWSNARVEVIDEWEGKSYKPVIHLGNHVNIGQNLHLTCAEEIIIEDDVVCSARVTITDINHITEDRSKAVLKQPIITKPVRVCKGAFIGINATVLPGVRIGKHAVVGANSVVTKDVPDYAIVAGTPARIIHNVEKSE